MRLVDAATNADIGVTTVDIMSETDNNKFVYGSLPPDGVKLEADGLYYILSEEMEGGDQIYDQDTTVTTRPEAASPAAFTALRRGFSCPSEQKAIPTALSTSSIE
jgi:hypothetical protein